MGVKLPVGIGELLETVAECNLPFPQEVHGICPKFHSHAPMQSHLLVIIITFSLIAVKYQANSKILDEWQQSLYTFWGMVLIIVLLYDSNISPSP